MTDTTVPDADDRELDPRDRLRHIDNLLQRLESLRLRGEDDIPLELVRPVYRLAAEGEHPLVCRPLRDLSMADWIDALLDLRSSLVSSLETGEPDGAASG